MGRNIAIQLVGILLTWVVWRNLLHRMEFELAGYYDGNAPVVWTIGRGILKGFKPWHDLFDNKGPGIFILSALAFWCRGDFWLTQLAQGIAVLGIGLLPIIALFGRPTDDDLERALSRAFLIPAGGILALYTVKAAGGVQTESFGIFFGMAYVCTLAWQRPMPTWLRYAMATVCLAGAAAFGGPFILSTCAIALILRQDLRRLVSEFLIPAAIAVAGGGLLLTLFRWVGPFYEYLDYLLGPHLARAGSPWRRAIDLGGIVDNFNGFAPLFGWLVVLAAVGILTETLRYSHSDQRVLAGVRWGAALYLTSLAVAIGGHHSSRDYLLAVPPIFACFLELSRPGHRDAPVNAPQVLLLPMTLLVTIGLPTSTPRDAKSVLAQLRDDDARAQASADYIDRVLDRIGAQQYAFLGAHRMQAYALTNHPPLGPIFFQLADFGKVPAFQSSLLEQIGQAKFLVWQGTSELTNEFAATVMQRVERDYTQTPPSCLSELKEENGMGYKYYFRQPVERLCDRRPPQ